MVAGCAAVAFTSGGLSHLIFPAGGQCCSTTRLCWDQSSHSATSWWGAVHLFQRSKAWLRDWRDFLQNDCGKNLYTSFYKGLSWWKSSCKCVSSIQQIRWHFHTFLKLILSTGTMQRRWYFGCPSVSFLMPVLSHIDIFSQHLWSHLDARSTLWCQRDVQRFDVAARYSQTPTLDQTI